MIANCNLFYFLHHYYDRLNQNQHILKPINWETLYRNNAPKLKGVCRRYVGNEAIADDLVQETFITAIEKAGTLRSYSAIEGWISKIAVNKALQYLREQQHVLSLEEAVYQPVNETVMEQSRNKIRAAIEQASFSAGELLKVIDHLPLHHRMVFNLYVMEGYSHNQIAQMLSISPGTSKSHLSRARKKAQDLLFAKAQEQQSVIQRRNLASLLLFLWPGRPVDFIFRRGLKGFGMAAPTPAFIQNAAPINALKWTATITGKAVIYGSAATLIAGTCWLALDKSNNEDVPNIPQAAIVATLPDTTQSIAPDTFMVEVIEPASDEQIQQERVEPEQATKPEPVIIKKTIIIRDTVRIEKPVE
jgi:RNA polymerase sigma factor (sigma-70 family)